MKCIYFILIFGLCFLKINIIISAQCDNNIILTSQNDIDSFATNYGCAEINGNLIIEEIEDGNITNLLGLSEIVSIEDTLYIYRNNNLENLDGLNGLTSIGGNLCIIGNYSSSANSLVNIDGLSELISIGGSLIINSSSSLLNLNGLSGLTSVGDNIDISINNSLLNVDGLSELTSIEGSLLIRGNNSLLNLNGLSGFNSVGKVFSISQNNSLLDINSLSGLTSIGNSLWIDSNPALLNLNGLSSLTSIGGVLRIWDNTSLLNLNGLSELTSIERIWIIGNPSLLQVDGLSELTSVGDYIEIKSNPSLLDLNGLSGINSIGGHLSIIDNDNLSNLYGLSGLTSIGGSLWIENSSLVNIDDLSSLNFIGGDLTITNNSVLTSCCIVTNLTNITQGTIEISDNTIECSSLEDIFESCNFSILSIQAFYDDNENTLQDGNEQILYNLPFTINPPVSFYINNQNGSINFYTSELGNYTITYNNEESSLWQLVNEIDSYTIEITEQLDTSFYFPMQPITNFISQQVDVSTSVTRCNQLSNIWLTYENESSELTNGYVNLVADEFATFISAIPPVDSIVGDTLLWYYQDLHPTHSKQIHIIYDMPGVDLIGENLEFNAQIATWEGEGKDEDLFTSELICAYDPNDKLVTPSGIGEENYILFEDSLLHYTIRFQNTGNDTAFNITIKDIIQDNLDIETFQFIASSHDVSTKINENTKIIEFLFEDIYLPDSNVNEIASHGFIKFSIETQSDLAANTLVENTANIFFDFNPPIVTNTTTNTIVFEIPTSIISIREKQSILLYPNPNTGAFIIKFKDIIHSLKIYNSIGQLIQEKEINDFSAKIDLQVRQSDIYFVVLEAKTGTFVEKLLIH